MILLPSRTSVAIWRSLNKWGCLSCPLSFLAAPLVVFFLPVPIVDIRLQLPHVYSMDKKTKIKLKRENLIRRHGKFVSGEFEGCSVYLAGQAVRLQAKMLALTGVLPPISMGSLKWPH